MVSGDPAGPEEHEPYRDNPDGRLYDSDNGYYMVESDGSMWELDLSGFRVDKLPRDAEPLLPVPAGRRDDLADVVHQLISETGAECVESEDHQPLCFHVAYGVAEAGWRPVSASPAASSVAALLRRAAAGRREYAENAPEETRQVLLTEANAFENAARIAEGDQYMMRSLLPSWRWDDVVPAGAPQPEAEDEGRKVGLYRRSFGQQVRHLLDLDEAMSDGDVIAELVITLRAGSPRVGRDQVEAAARELRILTRCTCQPPYPLVSGRRDPSCLEDYREDVETLAAALGVDVEDDEEEQ